MENTLTKEERNRVYKKALEFGNKHNEGFFICEALRESCEGIHPKIANMFFSDVIKCFPEALSQKPEDAKDDDAWFGNMSNTAPRIEILEKCIELTN